MAKEKPLTKELIITNYQKKLTSLEKKKETIPTLKYLRAKVIFGYQRNKEILKLQKYTMPRSEYVKKREALKYKAHSTLLEYNLQHGTLQKSEYDKKKRTLKNKLKFSLRVVKRLKKHEEKLLKQYTKKDLTEEFITTNYQKRLANIEKKKEKIPTLKYLRAKAILRYQRNKEILRLKKGMMSRSEYFKKQEVLKYYTLSKLLEYDLQQGALKKSEYTRKQQALKYKFKLASLKVKRLKQNEDKQENLAYYTETLKMSKDILKKRKIEHEKRITRTNKKLETIQKDIKELKATLEQNIGTSSRAGKWIRKKIGQTIGPNAQKAFTLLKDLKDTEKKLKEQQQYLTVGKTDIPEIEIPKYKIKTLKDNISKEAKKQKIQKDIDKAKKHMKKSKKTFDRSVKKLTEMTNMITEMSRTQAKYKESTRTPSPIPRKSARIRSGRYTGKG
ncbi:MAG: hypothetical protein HRU36_02900 [Rickettsiales bacterium]|nr:hypothetical protein [Rickettsiales bacterium]